MITRREVRVLLLALDDVLPRRRPPRRNTSGGPVPSKRRLAFLALLLVAELVGVLALVVSRAESAAAHGALPASAPAADEQVAQVPAQVVLTFNDDVLTTGDDVLVLGQGAMSVGTGTPLVQGDTITQQLQSDLPAGRYTVTWRATSADGQLVSGAFTFTAAGPSVLKSPVSSAPQESASGSPSAGAASATAPGVGDDAAAQEPQATAGPEPAQPAELAATTATASTSPLLVPFLIILGLAVMALVVVVAMQRNHRGRTGGPDA